MEWEYRMYGAPFGDGAQQMFYINRVTGIRYDVPDGRYGDIHWEQMIRTEHDAIYGVRVNRPDQDVVYYASASQESWYSEYPGPAKPPEPRKLEDQMRLMTKLSLLWERENTKDLVTLIDAIRWGGHGVTTDQRLEEAIDSALARVSA